MTLAESLEAEVGGFIREEDRIEPSCGDIEYAAWPLGDASSESEDVMLCRVTCEGGDGVIGG